MRTTAASNFSTSSRPGAATAPLFNSGSSAFDYTGALGALLRLREQSEESVDEDRIALEEFATRNVDRLHGQIRLDAQTLTELRRVLRSDPSNADIESALRAVDQKQGRNLVNMAAWLEVLQRQGIDTAGHRALLIQQQGLLGTEILQREVPAEPLARLSAARSGQVHLPAGPERPPSPRPDPLAGRRC